MSHLTRLPLVAIAAVVLITFALLSSCDSSLSLPKVKEREGPRVPAIALAAAEMVFQERFGKRGGSFYTVKVTTYPDTSTAFAEYMQSAMQGELDFAAIEAIDGRAHPQLLSDMELIEMKGLRTEIVAEELSQADELNGITWKGRLLIKAESERRRRLDLMASFVRLAEGEDFAVPPWTEHILEWRPSDKARAQLTAHLEAAKQPQRELTDEEKVMRMWGAMGEQLLEAFLEDYKGGEWGDWWTPETNAYQVSDIVVRNGLPQTTTLEDVHSVLVDGKTVALYMSPPGGTGFLGLLTSNLEDPETFLLRPNLKALDEADLLD